MSNWDVRYFSNVPLNESLVIENIEVESQQKKNPWVFSEDEKFCLLSSQEEIQGVSDDSTDPALGCIQRDIILDAFYGDLNSDELI